MQPIIQFISRPLPLIKKQIKFIGWRIKRIKVRVKKTTEELSQSQRDKLLIFTLIALLGTTGWIEYNYIYFIHFESDVQPITLRSLSSLKERVEPVLHPNQSEVTSLAFSPNGQTLASGSQDGTIKLWDWHNLTNSREYTLEKHSSRILSVAFSPDGRTLASFTETEKKKGKLNIRGLSKNSSTKNIPFYITYSAVTFKQGDDILASACEDGTISLWRVSSDGLIDDAKLKPSDNNDKSAVALAFYPSITGGLGKELLLASGSDDGTIKLWSITKFSKLSQTRVLGYHNKIRSLAFSHSGQILASGSDDGTIKLWNLSNGKELRTLRSHPYAVNSLAFAPKDMALASGSDDETIKIWQASSQPLIGWRQPPLPRLW